MVYYTIYLFISFNEVNLYADKVKNIHHLFSKKKKMFSWLIYFNWKFLYSLEYGVTILVTSLEYSSI